MRNSPFVTPDQFQEADLATWIDAIVLPRWMPLGIVRRTVLSLLKRKEYSTAPVCHLSFAQSDSDISSTVVVATFNGIADSLGIHIPRGGHGTMRAAFDKETDLQIAEAIAGVLVPDKGEKGGISNVVYLCHSLEPSFIERAGESGLGVNVHIVVETDSAVKAQAMEDVFGYRIKGDSIAKGVEFRSRLSRRLAAVQGVNDVAIHRDTIPNLVLAFTDLEIDSLLTGTSEGKVDNA